MQAIRVDSMARLGQREEMNNAAYFENKNEAFPVIGSRVRRGPDWMFDNQDNAGPGTVAGHSEHGLILLCSIFSNTNFKRAFNLN
ncbi:hypothetical protein DPMN_051133 [Dreissena polymorpha]|uniref:Uncharacterized protein n=1 Tax=Dreissena polymorpha TaxID=45954 RepID=A0A9D4CHC3_DREPO|nr:hypothetical protein DPMN_051133 [Dreissena polymorpha]